MKFIDVDGNGTTDAIYHAAGIGTTSTHVLWEDSSFQMPSGPGQPLQWTPAPTGDPNPMSVQPTTGLPYFPINGSWYRPDFAYAALRDLADLDGDGDADGIALPFDLGFRIAPGVLTSSRPRLVVPQGAPGTLWLRVYDNNARGGSVHHVPYQVLTDWPIEVGAGGPVNHVASAVLATKGKLGRSPLRYKVEPINDLQMPLVDLNGDGKLDLVLTKRRNMHANYVPPGVPETAPAGVGAYAMGIKSLLRLSGALRAERRVATPTEGMDLDDVVRHYVESGAVVLVDDNLLRTAEPPPLFGRLETTAEEMLIPDFPPETMMVMLSAPGGLEMPGIPGDEIPPLGIPELPPLPEGPLWWQPRIDDCFFLPLRDSEFLGSSWFGFRFLYGSFRYVPRVYLTRGDAVREFESERTEDSSHFEWSLRHHLNDGLEQECTSLHCAYPPHVNFNTFFTDLNGDGLPDLVTAAKPSEWVDDAGQLTTCEDGHDVFLNRGYAFENSEGETLTTHSWTSASTVDTPFNQLANRDRSCHLPRPRFEDRPPLIGSRVFPTAAMAQADLDGDGRVDIVLAHQHIFTENRFAPVEQRVYRNTGRGFEPWYLALPSDVALSRNLNWTTDAADPEQDPYKQFGFSPSSWPRAGAADRARFVDLDNDGLVDIVVAGDCARPNLLTLDCVRSHWYRNKGDIPDRLVALTSSSGAWTKIDYASPKDSNVVRLPADGLRPAATMRVVKRIRSAAGPEGVPLGSEPFSVEEVNLAYENYVKDLVSHETPAFEKVIAQFVNSFKVDSTNTAPRETVTVTRTYDVRPEVLDALGTPLPVRHPLKGALVSTVTESGGWTSTDLAEYFVEPLGAGVRIRPRRELHGDTSPSGISAWTADETIALDPFGYPTDRVSGNWDGAVIGPAEQRRSTITEYENRTASWQLGLVRRTQSIGYFEDIDGNVDPSHVLSDVATWYDAQGNVELTKRVGIRGGTCAGPDDDQTTFEYWPNGLVKVVHEQAVHDPDTGEVYTRDVNTTYEAKSLYPQTVTTSVGKLVGGAFSPATTALTVSYTTDLRTGQTTKVTPPSGRATTSQYDSRGRLLARALADLPAALVLVQNTYSDSFPVTKTSTITTDFNGKSYVERTHLDADGNVLSVVRGVSGGTEWSRKAKTRYDAFGRAVESFLPAFVASLDAGKAPDPAGPRHVTSYDGFDRPVQVVNADGTTTSTAYEPRETIDTNARLIATRRAYDAFGELVTLERNPGGDGYQSSLHTFVRDGRGEILKVVDADGSERRFERDGGGRLLHVTLPTAPSATPTRFSMCHDVDDKLVHLESPAGRVVDVVHDELGRTLATRGTDANGLYVETTQTYDETTTNQYGLGRLTSKSDESGTYNLAYDRFGFPLTVTFSPSERAKAGATNVAATYGASFSYSRVGLLKSVSFTGLPKAASLTYARDNFGRPTSVTTMDGTNATTLAADVTFDVADRVTSARYGNGTSGEWTFNPLSERLDRIASKSSAGAVLSAVSYVYDANGNAIQENREKHDFAGIYTQKVHDYDALDRLQYSNASTPNNTYEEYFTVTPSGNLYTAGWDVYTYASPVSSQAASLVENVSTGTSRALGYDPDGYLATDVTTSPDGSQSSRTLAFDPLGCMRAITRTELSPSGEPTSLASSEYTCGLDGRVVARATTKPDGSLSRRIDFAGLAEIRPDEGVFLLRVPVSGSVSVEDARSLSTGDRVTSLSEYLVSDIRGSVIATTSFDTGASVLAKETELDAWGKKLPDYSTLSSPRHGLAGAEADEAVGTYSFGARTYDPSLRRWVSPDPLLAALPGLDESIGDNLNLYAYAGNNPVARIDVTGFWGEGLAEALQNSRLANAVAGFAYGLVQGMTPGGALAPNPARDAPHGAVFQHWQGAGQVIGGGVGVAMNGTTTVAAAAAEGPTLGAATPVLVVSAVGVANGVLAVQAGGKNIAEAQARGDTPDSGPARTPNAASTSGAKSVKVQGPKTAASKETGSYTNTHESGKTYSGKGSRERSQVSGRRVEKQTGDTHVATEWKRAPNSTQAFKDEAKRIQQHGGARGSQNYNKIESPGKKMLEQSK